MSRAEEVNEESKPEDKLGATSVVNGPRDVAVVTDEDEVIDSDRLA